MDSCTSATTGFSLTATATKNSNAFDRCWAPKKLQYKMILLPSQLTIQPRTPEMMHPTSSPSVHNARADDSSSSKYSLLTPTGFDRLGATTPHEPTGRLSQIHPRHSYAKARPIRRLEIVGTAACFLFCPRPSTLKPPPGCTLPFFHCSQTRPQRYTIPIAIPFRASFNRL